MESESHNEHNLFNQAVGSQSLALLGIIPYLCAAFVNNERTARKLYWVPLIWLLFVVRMPPLP
jgi:hypothetical protein